LEIDDIIQETYARIVSLPSLDSIRHPRQYAIQTATSIIIDHVRHSRVISINSTGDLDQLDIITPEAGPEEQLVFRQEVAEIARALATLPEKCRETLILRRVEGLSQQQTAQRLGISVKTVEKHMARGVLMLMDLFGRGGKSRIHPSKLPQQERLGDDDQTVTSRDRPSGG
jgi:RNA polymerase sigma-70 factor (ECF subfamily)